MDKPKPPKPHPLGYPYMPTDIFAYGEAMAAWGAAQERERMQAKIDALMLEHCPDEMTEEQKQNWAAHQVPSTRKSDRYTGPYAGFVASITLPEQPEPMQGD